MMRPLARSWATASAWWRTTRTRTTSNPSARSTSVYQHIIDFARRGGFHNVTLNVWECNPGARKFYEAMGMGVQKTCMEQVL